jgi:hypothetical protein
LGAGVLKGLGAETGGARMLRGVFKALYAVPRLYVIPSSPAISFSKLIKEIHFLIKFSFPQPSGDYSLAKFPSLNPSLRNSRLIYCR